MSAAPRADWRTPAVMLAAGSTVLALSLGIRHGFGLFLAPMSAANGWTREVFALAMAVQNLVWGAAQPFAGRIADRIGAGKVVLVGTVLYVAGLLVMAQSRTGTALMISGILVGLGQAGTTISVVYGALARSASPERRSMAFGIAMSVGSIGQFVMLPAELTAMQAIGWSTTLVVLAGAAALMAPLSFALLERPSASVTVGAAPQRRLRQVLGEALSHRGFWLLCFGFFVCGFHVVFITTHLPAYLTDRGLPPMSGAAVLALVGLFNIFGSFLSGWLGARFSKPLLLSAIYGSRALVIFAFVAMPLSEGSAYLFGAAMGMLWLATVPLTNGTVAVLFGVENMAMLGGIVFFFHQVGAFMGGWLGGRIYVAMGDYGPVWAMSIALGILAGLINLPIREKPVERLQTAAEAAS